MDHEKYMKRALALAQIHKGKTGTNPAVGAVIVKEGKIIGEGTHRGQGFPHAEREALSSVTEDPTGATMVVTLEPCSHYGRTPPCTTAIIESGIRKVVMGCYDPDPRVSGRGRKILEDHGISVTMEELKGEIPKNYEAYFFTKKNNRPLVTVKAGMSLDGKTATVSGESQWITGSEALRDGHRERGKHHGILVGVGTVLADDPLLTDRSGEGRHPRRIVLDSHLRTSPDHQLIATAHEIPTYIYGIDDPQGKKEELEKNGAHVIFVKEKNGRPDLRRVLEDLYRKGIASLLVEGGSEVHGSFLVEKLVDRIIFYTAPILLGGKDGKGVIGGPGIPSLQEALRLSDLKVTPVGRDLKIEGRVSCLQES